MPRRLPPVPLPETGILKRCLPAGKADRVKRGEGMLPDSPPGLLHEPAVKGDVVQRQQGRPQHLVRLEQVVQVRPAEVAARVARTTRLERGRISLVAGV